MKKLRYVFRQMLSLVTIIMLVGMAPAPVFAEDPVAATNTDPAASNQQVQQPPASDPSDPANGPTGPDAHLFHYNATSKLWENTYYTYDPATKITTPVTPLEYTCNPTTHKWDTKIWQYDAASDSYVQAAASLDVVPDGAIKHDCPAPPAVTTPENTSAADTSTSATPPTSADTSTSNQNDTTNASLNTTVGSTATSGNAAVNANNNVNSVGTGNANASTNVINLLQSQASLAAPGVATFTANIQGNVTGDMVIDPANFTQPAGSDPNTLNNTKITNVTNGNITNNIGLNATTGNADVTNNNNIGTVTTGDASAIADVINMINSVVAANQSFVGTINIYGDYTGNILMPADSLNALLASTGSTVTPDSTTVNNTTNAGIDNNINLSAASGGVNVGGNNNVSSATTGNAMTNLTILNLTGKQVIAANSLLVFVNVMGQWVGLIMDAPAGTTAAALGGGVTANGVGANNTTINNVENYGITNNITAQATTGNANVTNNNNVGSVATGNALAGVNLANIINSNFSLSNWFGVLFINVFGTWHGNFDVKKPPVVAPITSGSALPGGMGGGGSNTILKDAKVFAFVPGSSTGTPTQSSLHIAPLGNAGSNSQGGGSSYSATPFEKAAAVLGASKQVLKPQTNLQQAAEKGFNYWTIILIAVGSAGLGFVAVERVRSSLRSRYIQR